MKPRFAYLITSDRVKPHSLDAGKRETLLFRDWNLTAAAFASQLTLLSDNFRRLLLDPRGHGESERPVYRCRKSRLDRDCIDFMNHLELQDADLLAHSAGCAAIRSFIATCCGVAACGLWFCLTNRTRSLYGPNGRRFNVGSMGRWWKEATARAASIAGPKINQVHPDFLSNEFGSDFFKPDVARFVDGSFKMPGNTADTKGDAIGLPRILYRVYDLQHYVSADHLAICARKQCRGLHLVSAAPNS